MLMEDSSDPDADLAGVTNDSEVKDNNESDRSKDEADDSLVITRNDDRRKVAFVDTIDAVEKSRLRFSKRDQVRADRIRRLQHVAGCPSDDTLVYSVLTNGIKNNPISQRDIEMCKDMLGRSKYLAKGKTTM